MNLTQLMGTIDWVSIPGHETLCYQIFALNNNGTDIKKPIKSELIRE